MHHSSNNRTWQALFCCLSNSSPIVLINVISEVADRCLEKFLNGQLVNLCKGVYGSSKNMLNKIAYENVFQHYVKITCSSQS